MPVNIRVAPNRAPPTASQRHAGRGKRPGVEGKSGTRANESMPTSPIVSGKNRPTPQAGDHFCTRTSKSANDAAATPALRIVAVVVV